MIDEVHEKIRPTVLLVEDKPAILKQREAIFRSFDFDTVVAQDYETALSKFRATPSISLVATDINLNPNEDDNQDGYKLAEDVHSVVPSLPIVAMSGIVSEEAFADARTKSLFKDSHLKASGLDKLQKKLPLWHKWAVDYLEKRITRGEAELLRLRSKYGISDYDFDLMREFIPLPVESPADLDALLSAKGYRLQIIETSGVPDECAGEGVTLLKSIPLWIQKVAGIFTAELYGFPQIYASGNSEDEAIRSTLFLMHGFFQDFQTAAVEDESGDSTLVTQLRYYLETVFSKK